MKRSGIQVMASLVGLVKPLTGYMSLAVLLGLLGHLCALPSLYWVDLRYCTHWVWSSVYSF